MFCVYDKKVELNIVFGSEEHGCAGGDAEEGFCTGSKLSHLWRRGFLFAADQASNRLFL